MFSLVFRLFSPLHRLCTPLWRVAIVSDLMLHIFPLAHTITSMHIILTCVCGGDLSIFVS